MDSTQHTQQPIKTLRQLAEERGVIVTITGGTPHAGFRLEFWPDYVVDCATFEDAVQEIELYAR